MKLQHFFLISAALPAVAVAALLLTVERLISYPLLCGFGMLLPLLIVANTASGITCGVLRKQSKVCLMAFGLFNGALLLGSLYMGGLMLVLLQTGI